MNNKHFNGSAVLEEEKRPCLFGYSDAPFEEEEYNRTELAYWLGALDKELREIQDTSFHIKRYLSELKK